MTANPTLADRFVLDADAPYLANLAALWAADPLLAAAIEATDGQPSYPVQASKSGPPTAAVPGPGGRPLYLHSTYEPVAEAARLIDPIPLDERVAFFVHGFGLGYHLELLFDRASEEAIFAVFEPDLLVLRTAFEHRDLSRLIEGGRVLFFTRADKSELFVRLMPHNGLLTMGPESISHPPSCQLQPRFHQQMAQWAAEFLDYARTGINTLVLNGRRTAENVARNIGWYAAAPGLGRLKGRHAGSPAIIVSAGPSLRKNKHLLKDAAGRAVIVAVQTTLQPLLELGVEPHFVTSLDYHEICTRFFERLPATLRTELVAEPKATDKIFRLNPGPLTLLGNDFAENLVHELKLDKPRLPAGATVAHLAYYLAEHMGCDPIIFVGQDLGFSDGLCYAPGTSYEDVWRPELSGFCTAEMKQWEQVVRDRPILRQVPDHAGRMMYTEERLFTYLQQFERDFARGTARVIDATEGGAAKRGATSMTLAAALEQYCARPLPAAPADHPGLRRDMIGPCLAALRARRAEAEEVGRISEETLPLLAEVSDALAAGEQPRVNRAIARIDALRRRMDALGRCYDLIMQLTQTTELARFERDRRLAASRAKGAERQRRQVERDVANARSVVDAAREFGKLMDEVIAKLAAEQGADTVEREAA